jgi:hypothetical protein
MTKRKQIENRMWLCLHKEIDEKYTRSFLASIRELITWEINSNMIHSINEALSE